MMGPDFARLMARYNAWQNQSLYAAAGPLEDAARRADRGAFFGSIHGTLCHVLWADLLWMSRLAGWRKPETDLRDSPALVAGWSELQQRRGETDAALVAWADTLAEADLAGDLAWYSGAAGRDLVSPRALCIAHLFNHQTHHRGQVHAMLTAAGGRPEPTDLFLLSETS